MRVFFKAPRVRRMPIVTVGIGGVAAGAAITYLLDPKRGARRRAEVRQRATHAAHQLSDAAEIAARDVAHRSQGLYAELRGRVADMGDRLHGESTEDHRLAERVRAKLGRLCAHPHSIGVACHEGRVTLRGPIFESEVPGVLWGVGRVRGVRSVDNRLEPHEYSIGVSGLQGGPARPYRSGLFRRYPSPSARVLLGAAGAGLVTWGALSRTLPGVGTGLVGLGLLWRSLSHLACQRSGRAQPSRTNGEADGEDRPFTSESAPLQ